MAEATKKAVVPADPDSVETTPRLVLSEDDLPTLLDLLHEVAHKWEEIATFLNLNQGAIRVIKCKEDEPQKKLMEIMRKWLTRTNPAPTVMTLVDTLRRPFIDEQKLALDVEKCFYRNSPACLQKSMSSSETQTSSTPTQGLDRSESSPAAVLVEVGQNASTQVNIPDSSEPPLEPKSHPDPDDLSTIHPCSSVVDHRSSYKYLDLEKMTDLEQRTLKGRLTNDYKRITGLYSELNQHVMQSLKDRKITPKQLSGVLMNLSAFRVQKSDVRPLLADSMDNIRGAEEVDDVFYILRSYGSFFDCHVIKHIVTSNLCTDDDRKKLENYGNELDNYCQRSVFECPHIDNPDPKFQSFVMKVDDVVLKSWEMKAIDAFRVKLAEACGLEGHTLRLCSVEMGCLELTFQVPPCVVGSLLPFTAEQKQRLKDLGVLKLTRSEYGGQAVSETLIDSSLPQRTKISGCAWYKLLGRCNYGDECRYGHDVNPIPNPVVGDLPDIAKPEALKQIPPSGYTTDGKAYIIAISQPPKEEMKIIAEDNATLEFAQAEVMKKLQLKASDHQFTRLKYSYIHPDGIELPVLFVFKKRQCTNEYELQNIKPKEPVKQMTVESFDHLTRKHVTPAYSRLYRHKKNVYPIQLRRDYREDIHEQLRQGLTWMHEQGFTPQLEGRFGKFTWRECIEDECFDVERLVSLTKETGGQLNYYTFNTEVDSDDVTALRSLYSQHMESREKTCTYTFTLKDRKGGEESYKVQVEFDRHGKQSIISIRKLIAGVAKVRVLLDILVLHRKYDIRVSLCSTEKVSNASVQCFISSTIGMPKPGILQYNPTASEEKWCVTYIRRQESEKFKINHPYSLDISTVGQYPIDLGDTTHHNIALEDFTRRCEVELHCDSWAISKPTWTPDSMMTDFENKGFLQMMEDLMPEFQSK